MSIFRGILIFILLVSPVLQAQTISREGRYELDRYLAESIESSKIPGVVALVTNGDGVFYHSAFGLMDVGNSKAMTRDAFFRIASMTKPVTSLAVMMLEEEGKIALDDPIEKFLPELSNREVFTEFNLETGEYSSRPAEKLITIRHLLTHTSGLGYSFDSPILTKALGNDFGASATSLPLLHEPGEEWTYGESTRVLGHLVEAVSGIELFEFMQERILQPLGMNETYYDIPLANNARTVTTHAMNGSTLVETPNPTGMITAAHNGDGGLSSTAQDYARFIRLFLNKGVTENGTRIVSEETIAEMGRNHTGDVAVRFMPTANPQLSERFPLGAGVDRYGLGFQVTMQHLENGRASGSLAWAGIFNTEFWIDPENNIGAVLMMQYLPFYDEKAIEVLQGFEERIYQNLELTD
jgi:methyl acetate hydrolase